MIIGWPQGIYIALALLGLLITAAKDGQPMEGKYNFALRFMITLCLFGLLYWGGFFG